MLEDFFTLTEMKVGLASLSRVEELVSVMRQQKDYVASDAARQLSTVAHILAATENNNCLNHFIRLNGMWFLDQWLQEAQRCTDNNVEESIKAFLVAVEKLPLDKEMLASSGIRITVRHLCNHKSLEIQERVKALLERWNKFEDTGTKLTVVGGCSETLFTDASSRETASEGTHVVESATIGFQHSNITISSDSFSAQGKKVLITNQETPQITSDKENANGVPENGHKLSETTSSGACFSLAPGERTAEQKASEISEFKDFVDASSRVEMEMDVSEDGPCKSKERETCTVPTMSYRVKEPVSFSAHPGNTNVCGTDPILPSSINTKVSESSPKKTASTSLANNDGIEKPKPNNEDVTSGPSGNVGTPRKQESPGASPLQGIDGSGTASDGKEPVGESGSKINIEEDSLTPIGQSDTLELRMIHRELEVMDLRGSGTVLGYEEEDALEVARQVAKEVERELETYREEALCSSSSEENAENEAMQSGSPVSVEGKKEELMMEQRDNKNETPIGPDVQYGGGPLNEETSLDRDDIKTKDPESSHMMATASVPEVDTARCVFDLNEDVQTEEGECTPIPFSNPLGNLSTPIPVIAASKGTLGFPVPPLHFEGELGWKGSAATSAFRPASLRKTLENEKTLSVEVSKERQDFLKIDLNVAEGDGDDVAALDLMSARHIPVSSSIPSGDDSVEVTSRREERLKLDLNRLGDCEDGHHWRVERLSHCYQNGNSSPSPASSSSSRQPSMRDIDLNDNPSFFETRPHVHHGNNEKSSGFKLSDPTISMMGPKRGIESVEFANPAQSFLTNGHSTFTRVGVGMGTQPALAYTALPPPPYGYNATIGMALPMSLPQSVYAPDPVPYTMDSRGAPMIPQIMGSSASVSSSFSRLPFIMSVTGNPPSHINGVGRIGLDLNSGMVSAESTVMESGSLRQFFVQGHSGLMEDQIKSGSQISGSGVTLKRKEPECGWDQFTLGYKQAASWH